MNKRNLTELRNKLVELDRKIKSFKVLNDRLIEENYDLVKRITALESEFKKHIAIGSRAHLM